jgi:hypothetical protein
MASLDEELMMKFMAHVGLSIVILVPAASLLVSDSFAQDKTVRPKFVVYASEEDAEFRSSLFTVLRGKGERSRIDKAETMEQALASEADVLVLVLLHRDLPKLSKETLEALRSRKIVGIGYGAAQLFGQLGLEINGGQCAHGVQAPARLTIGTSELLGEPKDAEPLLVLQAAASAAQDANKLDLFAVFLPPRGSNASVVDVIARWTTDLNYAPIVRQGNCVLIGIAVPATGWTKPYADLVCQVSLALHDREFVAYSAARRELTMPGVHKFSLAPSGSIDSPFEKTFYFQFAEPVRIHAELEHTGSDPVMLIFMGQDEEHTHWTRQDSRQAEKLTVETEISREDILKLSDRYWTLNVTNFGAKTSAECKLTITIEQP